MPTIIGRPSPSLEENKLLAFPARHSGIGLRNLSENSISEFHNSRHITNPLISCMMDLTEEYNHEAVISAQKHIKCVISKTNRES